MSYIKNPYSPSGSDFNIRPPEYEAGDSKNILESLSLNIVDKWSRTSFSVT